MLRWPAILLTATILPLQAHPPAPPADAPAYTADHQLKYPANYPEWVFLGTGLDMSYTADAAPADHSMFNSVFVNPSSYAAFKRTGHWPEGTVMVLENRGATSAASINKRGKTESDDLMGLEVHLKDSMHFKDGGWAFFNFDSPADHASTGKLIARPASCYTCHEQHGAVDTTFTQFYPAAFALARQKQTLSPTYLNDSK